MKTKTLTSLAAVAALIAGMSVAAAQSPMGNSSSMSKSSTASVAGSGKFCIKGASGALNCQYASLSACKKAASGSESCEANPASTTGSK